MKKMYLGVALFVILIASVVIYRTSKNHGLDISPQVITAPNSELTTAVHPTAPPTGTPIPEPKMQIVKGSYTDTQAGIKLTFPGTMYVWRTPEQGYENSNLRYGRIILRSQPDENDNSAIQIDYGTPELDGKGGMCDKWQTLTLDGVKATSTCIGDTSASIGYPVNPHRKIEYAIAVQGTQKQAAEYLKILKSGLAWL